MEDMRILIKAASSIQHALRELQKKRYLTSLERLADLVKKFKELGDEARKLGLSLERNWLSAANICCSRANRTLNETPCTVTRIRQLTEGQCPKVPELSSLVEEIKQLQQEFDSVHFDGENNNISVEIEPIELDGVYLGPFRIELYLDKLPELYGASPYCVVALDPHPAATDETVTHPHVSDRKLCEGDGAVTIRLALEQGRLVDFFSMVRSILSTYNPDSPYVSLDDWDGESCYNCGYVMSRENTYYCSYCERDYCGECATYCRSCDETICEGCIVSCESCEEPTCPNCVCKCAKCDTALCGSCLNEDICPNCKEEELNNDNEQNEIKETTEKQSQDETPNVENRPENSAEGQRSSHQTGAAVQSDSMGQAAVLQGQDG